MDIAELFLLLLAFAGILWALRPLRRWIRGRLSRRLGPRGPGSVIDGGFRRGPSSKDGH